MIDMPILIENSNQYTGKYVAVSDWGDTKVILSGDNPSDLYKQAKEIGIESPVVIYVPNENEVY